MGFDCRKLCRRPVEVRWIGFDLCKVCWSPVEVRSVCFDSSNSFKMLVEVGESVLTVVKRIQVRKVCIDYSKGRRVCRCKWKALCVYVD